VTPELDAGPVILQAAVPVVDGDSVDDLSARILEQEHQILPEALQWLVDGRCRLVGDQVVVG
jgi:phosphoribosylglycinamide formyltransferase-1